ncbi:DUF6428 family protein [Rhizobium sp.]|uniref:DUF6428 family protein n=1 Tax=Rhizobium sp. TaxID=391 RepID=UPI0028AD3322
MNVNDKTHSSDISLGHLVDVLSGAPDAQLIFTYGGNSIRPGYHVTEVKAAQFSALDCGANPEAWSEIFIQLWDIDEDDRTHMPAGKFSVIIRKVADYVRLGQTAKLTFEVSDGVDPMALYCASTPHLDNGRFYVELVARASSCKPRERWLAEKPVAETLCCGPVNGSKCCA